jgi:glyoxylase-like metal-dependent hydrolase (beta-lactamase superfamily II)
MAESNPVELLRDLYLFRDTCNVYVLRCGEAGLAVDFGSGAWLKHLPALGVRRLEHVLLTHHHVDQCRGLQSRAGRGRRVHAPAGDKAFLAPAEVRRYWANRRGQGCPPSYSVLGYGLPGVLYDLAEARDLEWGPLRIRFLPTPGHGPHAHSVILNWAGRQVVFCGDAAHAGATLWQPYHLEWDHWTGAGALAAWAGLSRLAMVGMDLLCPSHGPVVDRQPARMLRQLMGRVLRFYQAKLSSAAGERDEFWPVPPRRGGIRRILPHLYSLEANGYVLVSDRHEALVVDLIAHELPTLERLLRRLGGPRLTAALVTHYHSDHSEAVPLLQKRWGARAVLHPWVAKMLATPARYNVPFARTVARADEWLPETGTWRWNEYPFRVAPFPGQTWWHVAHQVAVDGVRVLFGGDNFQPNSRWNGAGGFSSYNGSRFREGFARSAQLVLDWSPDLLCCGHGTFYRFHPDRFRKVQRWARRAEQAVRALCPSGDLEQDYYLHRMGPSGLRPKRAQRGQDVTRPAPG